MKRIGLIAANAKLPHVKTFKDRHGRVRHYLRRKGFAAAALPGEIGSPEFMAAYDAALARPSPPARQIGVERTVQGTFGALIAAYYLTDRFANLNKTRTQPVYRREMERLREMVGDAPVRDFRPTDIQELLDELAGKPGAAYNRRRYFSILFDFALEKEWIESNPMHRLKKVKKATKGHDTWSEADITAFCQRWPSGTRERLALALLLYTAQRRRDVVRMGRQQISNGILHIRQSKSERFNQAPTELFIPVHPDLQREIDQAPLGMTFLLNEWGAPFKENTFTTWFGRARAAAGLPAGLTPHGLRKAAMVRLAEAGCSASEIMAISGHKTMADVEMYVRAASKKKLALAAINRITAAS